MEEVYLTTTEELGDLRRRGDIQRDETTDANTDRYEIVGREGAWHVVYGGERGMAYATKEAAFEAAVAAATNAIHDGHDVTIHVAGSRTEESLLGTSSQ